MAFPRVKLSRLFAFALLGAALLASAVTLQPADETDSASPPPATAARAQALSRCGALAPQDAGNPACTALWKAERQRFLGLEDR